MRVNNEIISAIKTIITEGQVLAEALMSEFTSFKTGGPADCLVIPGNEAELIDVLELLSGTETKFIVIGNGTNLLVRDEGYRGIIIRLGKKLGRIEISEQQVYAQAGVALPELGVCARDAALTGLEFAAGIPGTVGGGIYMNAGAFGGEISDVFISARIFQNGEIVTLDHSEMGFSYRHCVIRENKGIILDAVFGLVAGNKLQITHLMQEISRQRKEKQPLDLPSAGSFFKRPQGSFAGKLIEEAGLSGLSIGDAEVSPKHAGFIVNRGRAKASDIIDLMEIVRSTVFERSGVKLEPEVRIIGEISNDL